MRVRVLLLVVAAIGVCRGADAHFLLMEPASTLAQNNLGDPQKIAPCGGVSADPGRGTAANPGVPTNAVTTVKGGSTLHIKIQETVFHPGHYRVALARAAAQLPADPVVTTRDTDRGPRSVSAAIQNPAVPPVLADGLFAHTEKAAGLWETDITIPNVDCPDCLLQVIQFMAEHGRNLDGDYSYHHCAALRITADPAKPIDTRWAGIAAAQRGDAAPQAGQPAPAREVRIAAIPGVIAAEAKWSLAWAGSDNADGVMGMPGGAVLFAQEQPKRISRLDANGKVSPYVEHTHGAGSIALDSKGRLLAVERTCTDPGLRAPCSEPTRVAIIYPEKARTVLADSYQGKDLGRLNDLVVAKNGTVYFTSGGAFLVSAAGKVENVGDNLRTNGIMLSPDEKTLYVTNGATIVAFDVQKDGAVRNQREFATLEAGGSGDGMAIDAAGRLYVTSQPGVQVFAPDGKYLGLIPTPRQAISAAFAGRDKKTLFIVGSGALDPSGHEMTTAPGVRNNAKSIFSIPMLAQGFTGRAK